MVQPHVATARSWHEAREILTPEQRSKLHCGMEMMRHMMPGTEPGMMGEMRPGGMRDGHVPPGGPPAHG